MLTKAGVPVVLNIITTDPKRDVALVKQVAQSIVSQHVNSRGIRADVLITVTDIIKLSDRIFVRMDIDNQSREALPSVMSKSW